MPQFVSEHRCWGELDREEMRRVNGGIQGVPWQAVLRDAECSHVRQAADAIMNLDQANWRLFLPLERASTVLDIGAGCGAVTQAMADACGHVIAVEPVLERVEFMRHRFRQEGLRNISVVRSDVHMLPILPGTVDLAVLNGVLPWIPWSDIAGRPRDVQVRALRRIHEVLRPGGYLCVAIENRWTLWHLAGARDPHLDLPCVAILPRSLASGYTRWKTGLPYRTFMYSLFGYRRVLRQAGFAETQAYCALPTYRSPRFIFPLDEQLFGHYARTYAGRQSSRWRRLILRALRALRVDKYLVHSFYLVGRK